MTAGFRYDYQQSSEEVSGLYLPDGSTTGFVTQPDTSGKATFNAVSPMISVSYHASENAHIYVSYNRGYRTGGLTQLSTDPTQPPLYPYQPEYSNNYELGFKSNYFSNRLHANLAVFYNTVQNAQVPTLILPDAITVIKNAGGLTSKGFEAEIQALPLTGLEVTYHIGYTHATYTSGDLSSNGNQVPLDGKYQVFTPDITSMLAVQYNKHITKSASAFIRGEWYYFGKQYFDLANQVEQSSLSVIQCKRRYYI